jgi:hypothetical protein
LSGAFLWRNAALVGRHCRWSIRRTGCRAIGWRRGRRHRRGGRGNHGRTGTGTKGWR